MAAVPPITVPIKVEVSDLDTLRACVQHLQEAQERMVEATQATLALLDALRRPEPTLDATQVHVGRCSRKDAHEDHLHYDHPAAESGEYREPWWCDGNDPDVASEDRSCASTVSHVGHVWFADPDPAASKADAPAYYCHGDLR